ncbi:MAG: hypothetical protein E7387_05040 [Ruminococcaceae bacterium]|nr:hypothetical protein [Oscillospiraceae bacterium]
MGTRVYVFTGHYGSGKTEAAVNFALKLKKTEKNVALIDLDIVNPFFRSADAVELLKEAGIRVEMPLFANTNVDIPALTGNMAALIRDQEWNVVLDVGGDDLGAKAVGRYSDDIKSRDFECFFVMNPNRPFTKDMESATKIFDEIEAASCIKCSAVIGSTNLLDETTVDTIIDGLPLLEEMAKSKNISIAYHAITASIADELIEKHSEIFNEDNVIRINRTVKRLF